MAKKRKTMSVDTFFNYEGTKYGILLQRGNGEFKWVTDVCYSPKTFRWDDGKEVYLFDDYVNACDTAYAMSINGYYAMVVTIHEWHTSNKNYAKESSVNEAV